MMTVGKVMSLYMSVPGITATLVAEKAEEPVWHQYLGYFIVLFFVL